MAEVFEAVDGKTGARRIVGPGDFLRDGERLNVSMMAFDHAPVTVPISDGEAAQIAYEKRISNAWRDDAPPVTTAAPARKVTDAVTTESTVSDSQAAYEDRLRNAWREGATP